MDNYNVLDKQYPEEGLSFSKEAQQHLQITAGWGIFFSILMFLFGGLCIIGGIAVIGMSSYTHEIYPFDMSWIGLFYIFVALFYLVPGFFLLRYSLQSRDAIRLQSSDTLTSAFYNQKLHYLVFGILIIAGIVLYLIMIVVMVGSFAALGGGF